MEMLSHNFLDLSNQTARFLFAWSWQLLLLLAIVALMIKLSGFRLSALRYRLWLIGLMAAALLPFCTLLIGKLSTSQSLDTRLNLIAAAPQLLIAATQALPDPIQPGQSGAEATMPLASRFWAAGFILWVAGLIYVLARLLRACRQSLSLRKSGCPVAFSELGCQELEKAGVPECRLCDGVASPMLVGLWHSTILLPADILDWTNVNERRAILLHEMVHAQRKDQWGNLLQAILSAIFYFHPLVRYACKQLCIERELSCDEQVLAAGTEASSYAESILKVAEKTVASDVLHQPAFITRKMLERRIEMIMKSDGSVWSARRWTLLILPVVLIAALLWVLAPTHSVSAQPTQEVSREEREARERRAKLEQENETKEKARTIGYAENSKNENELREHREREINQMLEGAEILARVSELQLIYGKPHNENEKLIDVSAEQTDKDGDEVKLKNVVVKTPEFTFRAELATDNDGVTNLIGNPIEVEQNGRVYYSYSAIAVAQRRGMVLYVINKRGTVFTEKNPHSLQVEFGNLLRQSRD